MVVTPGLVHDRSNTCLRAITRIRKPTDLAVSTSWYFDVLPKPVRTLFRKKTRKTIRKSRRGQKMLDVKFIFQMARCSEASTQSIRHFVNVCKRRRESSWMAPTRWQFDFWSSMGIGKTNEARRGRKSQAHVDYARETWHRQNLIVQQDFTRFYQKREGTNISDRLCTIFFVKKRRTDIFSEFPRFFVLHFEKTNSNLKIHIHVLTLRFCLAHPIDSGGLQHGGKSYERSTRQSCQAETF